MDAELQLTLLLQLESHFYKPFLQISLLAFFILFIISSPTGGKTFSGALKSLNLSLALSLPTAPPVALFTSIPRYIGSAMLFLFPKSTQTILPGEGGSLLISSEIATKLGYISII